jgi:tetratricopeptide (TPR) repeat protein
MTITLKNHFKKHRFVDREGYLHNFKEIVNNLGQKKYNVLVYHGVAGIGKTSLRKEFPKILEEYNLKYQQQEVIWASIDLQLEKHREKNTFLITLKNNLQKKHKLNFLAFEIAHAIYWKKANPEIPLRKENYLLFEGDNAFDDFFGVINQIPYFSIVPATARLLKSSPDYLRKWWAKRGEEELKQLLDKEPLEIEEMLPYFWAQDLNNYLEHTSKTAVLFIDTYEALWENHRDEGNFRDEWIREDLIPRFQRNVLWVICGREALQWKQIDNEWGGYLTQYEVEELLRKYCMEYLEIRGITDKEIQEAIFKGSKGVPYHLELSADTYAKIVEIDEKPKPEDFGNNFQEIANRFFRYLSPEEKNSLNVLSIPRFWDYDLFKYLVKEFNTGYSTNNYEDLCSFSFIEKVEYNKQQMHHLMQDCLQRNQIKKKADSVKNIHKAIYEYYVNKLENTDIKSITSEHEIALTEAFYHAKELMEAEDLLHWFIDASDPFNRAALWQLIVPLYEEVLKILEEKLGSEHPSVANSLNNLALLYHHMGDHKKALPLYERALDIREKVLGPQHPSVANSLNNLALLYHHMGDYEKARPLYQRALDIREKVLGPQHPDVANSLNNLAALYLHIGDYEKARPLYQKSEKISKHSKNRNI